MTSDKYNLGCCRQISSYLFDVTYGPMKDVLPELKALAKVWLGEIFLGRIWLD